MVAMIGGGGTPMTPTRYNSTIGVDLNLPVPKMLMSAGFDLENITMESFRDLMDYMSKAGAFLSCGVWLTHAEKDPTGIVAGIPVSTKDVTDAQFSYIIDRLMHAMAK